MIKKEANNRKTGWETRIWIDDYANTTGISRVEHNHSCGPQCGNPDKGAKLILGFIKTETPLFKFILGGDAWEVYKQREMIQNVEMEIWLDKSRQTVFES